MRFPGVRGRILGLDEPDEAQSETLLRGGPARTAVSLFVSLIGGAGLLWLASRWIDLFPDEVVLARTDMLVVGCLLYLPYVYARSIRMRFVLDPMVREVGPEGLDGPSRLDWRLLHGSGLFSFFVVLLLPLRLGELSRPLILARAKVPGVDLPGALAATAVERIVDGVLVTGCLLLGLAFLGTVDGDAELAVRVEYVRGIGRGSALLFVPALIVFLVAARKPGGPGRTVHAVLGRGPLATRLASVADKAGAGVLPLWDWRQGLPFLLWSVLYVVFSTAQMWALMWAVGFEVGFAHACVMLGALGLSIQLPGGPAQTGSFQLGAAVALSIFADAQMVGGSGSSFAILSYAVYAAGPLISLPFGAVLLRAARRRPRHHPAPSDDVVSPPP